MKSINCRDLKEEDILRMNINAYVKYRICVISMQPKECSSFQDLTEDKCIKTILREAVMNVRTSLRVGLDKF